MPEAMPPDWICSVSERPSSIPELVTPEDTTKLVMAAPSKDVRCLMGAGQARPRRSRARASDSAPDAFRRCLNSGWRAGRVSVGDIGLATSWRTLARPPRRRHHQRTTDHPAHRTDAVSFSRTNLTSKDARCRAPDLARAGFSPYRTQFYDSRFDTHPRVASAPGRPAHNMFNKLDVRCRRPPPANPES